MSWYTMSAELAGQVPVNIQLALTLVNRAYVDIQKRFNWSFLQGIDIAIPTTPPITAGTVTLTRGSKIVTGDATAVAAWNAIGLVTPIGALQFRVGTGTIYNIVSLAGNNLTLDRLFVDPVTNSPLAGQGYSILQCYFNAPFQDFLWWDSFLDPVTGYPLDLEMTRKEVDDRDPQRLQNNTPIAVIPYTINPQAGAFFQFPMYEMWPSPASGLTYVGKAYRSGAGFINPTDTVAAQLGEDIVLERAKKYAYEWCEANRDKLQPAQRQGDFKFLMGKSEKEFTRLENDYIFKDEQFSHFHVSPYASQRKNLYLPWVSQANNRAYFPDF
jgi:hypothetical protein